MKPRIVAVTLFLTAVIALSYCTGIKAESQVAVPVEIGQAYKVLLGMGALRFKILEIGKGGLVKVQAVEDASHYGIKSGSSWWLNLNQALLVEAIK